MQIQPFDPNNPPIENKGVRSRILLCLVETPSAAYWIIGYYDDTYKKDAPWRDIYNHPLRGVTHYCDLPEVPEKEVRHVS